MKNIKIIMILAVLAMAWGCSDDDKSGQNEPQWTGSTFALSAKPEWKIDWTSDATQPDWQEPSVMKYECYMNMLVTLSNDIASYSTDDDRIAVFMGDECRGVSYPNKLSDGKVEFLLHVVGNGEEAGQPMELRYYCDGLHHLSVSGTSPFVPNNVLDRTYQRSLHVSEGSTKYPIFTSLTVILSKNLPFNENQGDMLAVFVGDECRGVGSTNREYFEGWKVTVYSRYAEETAQIRYYSAEKGGIYTILKTIKLNNNLQQEQISF